MSRENGQLRTCDRCGKFVFLPYTGEKVADGGYTRWSTFDDALVEGWSNISNVGDVCPACKKDFDTMLEKYKRRPATVKEV